MTPTGKTGAIVALIDGYLVDVRVTCRLVEKHQRGQKPSKKRPVTIVCRYHRDDVRVVAQEATT